MSADGRLTTRELARRQQMRRAYLKHGQKDTHEAGLVKLHLDAASEDLLAALEVAGRGAIREEVIDRLDRLAGLASALRNTMRRLYP